MTGFKPPYWGRSRTHLRNGCNRFPPCRGLPPLRPTFPLCARPPSSRFAFPPCAALPSPLRRVPPLCLTFLFPFRRAFLKPPCAAATLPPFARLPPVRAALPRRYAGPSLRCASLGDSRPRFGHGPAAGAAGRGLRRGRLSSPLARLRVELARGALARLRLGRCPRRPRGPVPFGQSGPREDRRGSSRRSAALFRPAGFGWGRARIVFCFLGMPSHTVFIRLQKATALGYYVNQFSHGDSG